MNHTNCRIKTPKGSLDRHNYVCLGSKHKGSYIRTSEIVYIQAYENYAWLYLCDGSKHLSCKSIGHYQSQLEDDCFIRIHRSYLINILHLRLYEPKYRLVHLVGEAVLPVSFRRNRILSKHIIDQKLILPLAVAV